jgi:hypothetical protein
MRAQSAPLPGRPIRSRFSLPSSAHRRRALARGLPAGAEGRYIPSLRSCARPEWPTTMRATPARTLESPRASSPWTKARTASLRPEAWTARAKPRCAPRAVGAIDVAFFTRTIVPTFAAGRGVPPIGIGCRRPFLRLHARRFAAGGRRVGAWRGRPLFLREDIERRNAQGQRNPFHIELHSVPFVLRCPPVRRGDVSAEAERRTQQNPVQFALRARLRKRGCDENVGVARCCWRVGGFGWPMPCTPTG